MTTEYPTHRQVKKDKENPDDKFTEVRSAGASLDRRRYAGELETSTNMAYMKDKGIYDGSVFMEHSGIFQTSILTTPKNGI